MNPNSPPLPNKQDLAKNLMNYALKNRYIRDEGVAHKMAHDFLANVELYLQERLAHDMFEQKVEAHKLNVKLNEAYSLNALLEVKILESRRVAENMIELNTLLLERVQGVIAQQEAQINRAQADLVQIGY
jgi:hypothetical protein